jgi:KUP system potassium uptake protein
MGQVLGNAGAAPSEAALPVAPAVRKPGSLKGGAKPALMLGALGVVYGDIGTSPLYAFKEGVKAAIAGGAPVSAAAIGGVSLILWALILIVSAKYAVLILRADNKGEGGIVAMLALLGARNAEAGSWRALLLVVGLIGAALLYGDGAITPAISVLAAVEGLKVDAPVLTPFVVPITITILVGLFLVQRRGVAVIGRIFGPVMLVWFVVIALLGIPSIVRSPEILLALNPWRAIDFLVQVGWGVALAMLGAAFLAVTGGEAMYADLGHFGATPIRVSWFGFVLPALVVHYCGQGALLLAEPDAIENPFYRLAPDWAHYPLIGLATVATIIASQAIISGAFSLTQQSIQLGFMPAMHVVHTAHEERGQIYVPVVNWALAIATLMAVVLFGSSDALAGAYGIAVSGLMAITTLMAALIALRWGYNPLAVFVVNGFFLVIDLVFLAANSAKLFEGGWFPLLLAFAIAFLMLTWMKGNRDLEVVRESLRQSEKTFLARLTSHPPVTLPGTAAFLTVATEGIPTALGRLVERSHCLHERILLITVTYEEVPVISASERAQVTLVAQGIRKAISKFTPGMERVVLRYGFMQTVSIPEGLQCAVASRLLPPEYVEDMTFFVGHEVILPAAKNSAFRRWRGSLFAFMKRNAESTGAFFGIPARQIIEVGTEIEI